VSIVLLVDDHPVHRAAIRYFLRQRGHEVVLADDGAQALERVGDSRPDLILLDLAMPNLDGLGVLAALRTAGRAAIPVVVVTASSDAGTLAVARELGAREVLVKTWFSLTALADAVDRAVAGTAAAASTAGRAPARMSA
jgi:CheY-like chemotaxis protein